MADAVLTGNNYDDDISAADRYFAMLIQPKSFSGKDNTELKYDIEFEDNCILLSSLANKPVKELTTKEYFSLIKFHNDKISNGRKSNPQRRYN